MVLIAEYLRMTSERRAQSRSNLRAPVFVLRAGCTTALRTETEDVSMDGFFFYTHEPFAPGERLHFLLFLPAPARSAADAKTVGLQGLAEVTRVVTSPLRSEFGIGCRLVSYRVLPNIDTSSDGISSLLVNTQT